MLARFHTLGFPTGIGKEDEVFISIINRAEGQTRAGLPESGGNRQVFSHGVQVPMALAHHQRNEAGAIAAQVRTPFTWNFGSVLWSTAVKS